MPYVKYSPPCHRIKSRLVMYTHDSHILYMCWYTYIYMYICEHEYICMHTYVYIYIYIYKYTHTYIYIYIHSHIYMYKYIYAYIYIYIYIYIFIWILGPYYPCALIGPIVVGTATGSFGAFFPTDKGLAAITNGMPWPLQVHICIYM
jgi:hypothetical protein